MKKLTSLLMILLLTLTISGCGSQNVPNVDSTASNLSTDDPMEVVNEAKTFKIYFSVFEESQAWLINQSGDIMIQRAIFRDKNENSYDVYSETVYEFLSDENYEVLKDKSSTEIPEVLAEMYNEFSAGAGLESRIVSSFYDDIDFRVSETDGTKMLVSTRFKNVNRMKDNKEEDALECSEIACVFGTDEEGTVTLYKNDVPVEEILLPEEQNWFEGGEYTIDNFFSQTKQQ
jgi:hypothetical protein